MSFKIIKYNPKARLPNADLCIDKVEMIYKIIENVTPKISGEWDVQVIDPTLKECKSLIECSNIPGWFNITIYLPQKKLDLILAEFPEFSQKEKTFKEQARDLLAEVKHVIDKRAFNTLVEAFRGNIADLQQTLITLDEECKGSTITLKDVQAKVNYTKPVYASEVMDAFFFHQESRWKLLHKLIQELGESYAYNAIYKYVKTLLHQKDSYLRNANIDLRIVKRVDAPSICYAYTLFSLSKDYRQLYGVLQSFDTRSLESLERMENVNLQ